MTEAREALVQLPEDVLLGFARQHLEGLSGVFLAPDIPPGKVRGARAAHGLHLRASEPIVVLFDDTMFGSARDGFVATPAQLCWKGFLSHPRRILWDDLAALQIYAEDRHVEIALGEVPAPWVEGGPERVRQFLVACRQYRRGAAAPYREPARVRETPTLAESIVRIARRSLGEREWVHYAPSIPDRMLAAVRTVHAPHLAEGEEVLVLYDDTLFGSGNDGWIVTEHRLCWRGFLGAPQAQRWSDLAPSVLGVDGDLLLLGEGMRIDLRLRPGMARLVADVLRQVAELVRRPAQGPGAT